MSRAVLYLKVADELPPLGERCQPQAVGHCKNETEILAVYVRRVAQSSHGCLGAGEPSRKLERSARNASDSGRHCAAADTGRVIATTLRLPMQVHLALFNFWAAYPHGLLIDSNAWTRVGEPYSASLFSTHLSICERRMIWRFARRQPSLRQRRRMNQYFQQFSTSNFLALFFCARQGTCATLFVRTFPIGNRAAVKPHHARRGWGIWEHQ